MNYYRKCSLFLVVLLLGQFHCANGHVIKLLNRFGVVTFNTGENGHEDIKDPFDVSSSKSDSLEPDGPVAPADPETTTTEAETTTLEAETTTLEAETTTLEAETTTLEAETTTLEAETTTSEAETTTLEAETTTSEAETTTSEAETTTSEAETTTSEAETTTSEAETTTSEAETTTSEAETTTSEAETTTEDAGTTAQPPNPGDKPPIYISDSNGEACIYGNLTFSLTIAYVGQGGTKLNGTITVPTFEEGEKIMGVCSGGTLDTGNGNSYAGPAIAYSWTRNENSAGTLEHTFYDGSTKTDNVFVVQFSVDGSKRSLSTISADISQSVFPNAQNPNGRFVSSFNMSSNGVSVEEGKRAPCHQEALGTDTNGNTVKMMDSWFQIGTNLAEELAKCSGSVSTVALLTIALAILINKVFS